MRKVSFQKTLCQFGSRTGIQQPFDQKPEAKPIELPPPRHSILLDLLLPNLNLNSTDSSSVANCVLSYSTQRISHFVWSYPYASL